MTKSIFATTTLALAAFAVACTAPAAEPAPAGPTEILVETDFVAFQKGDIATLADKKGFVSTQDLIALRTAGKGTLRYAPQVVALSGQEAILRGVTEYTYPAGLVWSIPTNAPFGQMGAVMAANGFEAREAGTVLRVLPKLRDDGTSVQLDFTSEIVHNVEWKDYSQAAVPGVASVMPGLRAERPVFHTHSVSSQVIVKDGETKVLGGGMTTDKDNAMVYVFVTVKVLKN